ncbi:MAG: arsenic transporter [Acidobacteriota bacterium]|nr:arsenic transporter [Acidobacteriota bacterium]
MAPGWQHILLILIVATSILLMLVRPRNIPEVYWVGSGALLLLALRLISPTLAARAVRQGSDVYLFLAGMMLLSALARDNGVFDWLSAFAVRTARGSGARLFALIYTIGTAVTIALSNDATAVVLTPAVLAATRRSAVEPLPYLFACAMIANAASFVLPISNPANLVLFRSGMPPLAHWLGQFALPSLLSIAGTFAVLRWYFRRQLRQPIASSSPASPLPAGGRLVLAGLALIVGVLLVASAFKWDLGLPTCLAALCITAAVCLIGRQSPLPLLREVSWSTLALVAALFVLVNAMEGIGALRLAHAALAQMQSLPPVRGALLTAFGLGLGNNVLNNLPVGLIAGSALAASHAHGLIPAAALIGVDLGPNLSVTGSLATILWLIALRKQNLNVGFVDFLKVGALAMPAALLVSIAGLLSMHALFRGL